MQIFDGQLVYSASDLIGHSSCSHMSALSIAHKLNLVDITPDESEGMAKLAGVRGDQHEIKVLDNFKAQGLQVTDFSDLPHSTRQELEQSARITADALERGDALVYQGIFFDGVFLGYPDFLIRIDDPKYKRGFTYEVWDAKLKRTLSAHAVLQMASYSRQLNKLGFEHADQMHAYLGDMSIAVFRVQEALPYLEKLTSEFEKLLVAEQKVPEPIWSSKIKACEICKWSTTCETGREQARDLSLVAKLTGNHRKLLNETGVQTIEQLAALSDDEKPSGIGIETFSRLKHQAQLQSKQDNDPNKKVIHEVFSTDGLALLPEPNEGDIWFDMEGDPFALPPNGLEYLFGVITKDTGIPIFKAFWAHSSAEEKSKFEEFVDWVEKRREEWPDLHIYHYASYERTRMGSLSSRYGTRETEIDDWLRNGVMVDLLKVVQRSVRISQRSYSIKKLEPLYDFVREEDVQTAGDSVVDYERYLELMDDGLTSEAQAKLDGIAAYNKSDCISTEQLDKWLREIAEQHEVPYFIHQAKEQADDEDDIQKHIRETLERDLPTEVVDRTPEQQAHALLVSAMKFYQRESRVKWWDYFTHKEADFEDWADQDKVAIVRDAKSTDWLDPVNRERGKRRHLTLTVEGGDGIKYGTKFRLCALFDEFPASVEPTGTRYVKELNIARNDDGTLSTTIIQSKTDPEWMPLPVAIIENKPLKQAALLAGTVEIAATAASEYPSYPSGPVFDLLARIKPGHGKVKLHPTGDLLKDLVTSLPDLENSYAAIQGPPGTGKTYLTARVIKYLVEQENWRIGVVAQSHKVVENVLFAAAEAGLSPNRIAKEPEGVTSGQPWQHPAKVQDWIADQSQGFLVAGTQYLYRRPEITVLDKFDLLVVEEAGQFSIANTISVSTVTKRLLLVGDPQQLPQVSQGSHPEPVDESALGWLMNGAEVIDSDFGYFLPLSYRMRPELCRPVSELSYLGKLDSAPEASERTLDDGKPGLHPIPVGHSKNSTSSPEEVAKVVEIVKNLTGQKWNTKDGTRELTGQDIMIVAPYNAQVSLIKRELKKAGFSEAEVGTIDKFQGQEAPVVILSMTASSPNEIPRGWEFLLLRNRLNVGISRGQWATYLIYSPDLANLEAKTPSQIETISAFLSLIHAADE